MAQTSHISEVAPSADALFISLCSLATPAKAPIIGKDFRAQYLKKIEDLIPRITASWTSFAQLLQVQSSRLVDIFFDTHPTDEIVKATGKRGLGASEHSFIPEDILRSLHRHGCALHHVSRKTLIQGFQKEDPGHAELALSLCGLSPDALLQSLYSCTQKVTPKTAGLLADLYKTSHQKDPQAFEKHMRLLAWSAASPKLLCALMLMGISHERPGGMHSDISVHYPKFKTLSDELSSAHGKMAMRLRYRTLEDALTSDLPLQLHEDDND